VYSANANTMQLRGLALWYNGSLSLFCLLYGALKLDGLRSLMMVLSLFMAR
jgi:hypothetical protein